MSVVHAGSGKPHALSKSLAKHYSLFQFLKLCELSVRNRFEIWCNLNILKEIVSRHPAIVFFLPPIADPYVFSISV